MEPQTDINSFRQVVLSLNELEIPYFLTGSLALAVYSRPRLSHDIDFCVHMQKPHVSKMVGRLGNDFYIDAQMMTEAIDTQHMFNIIHLGTNEKMDFFIFNPSDPVPDFCFQNLQKVKLFGLPVPIPTLEGILLIKLRWIKLGGGPIHDQDIRILIDENQDRIQWDRVNRVAEQAALTGILRGYHS